MHTHKQLTEAELRDEIAKTLDGAVSSFENEPHSACNNIDAPLIVNSPIQPKRRGRPRGSKNRPKVK